VLTRAAAIAAPNNWGTMRIDESSIFIFIYLAAIGRTTS
jgi:hypothetical protein